VKNTWLLLFIIIGFTSPIIIQGQNLSTVSSNYSPLHWASSQGYVEMIKVLIDKGYDINTQDINGFTPLHYAVASGNFSAVEYLINSGADVYIVNNRDMTPMTLAAQAGEQKIVDYLFVKMRSTKVEQLKAQAEKDRVNTDLAYAAKARAEAERLKEKADEWTKEATFWRAEAQKWAKQANTLKVKQVQIDRLAKERINKIIEEKNTSVEDLRTERLARNAAERLLREQSASTEAQIRAYEAQNAALAAQRATDAAIDNLADEFLKQGNDNSYMRSNLSISVPHGYEISELPSGGQNVQGTKMYFLDSNSPSVPLNLMDHVPLPENSSIELNKAPSYTYIPQKLPKKVEPVYRPFVPERIEMSFPPVSEETDPTTLAVQSIPVVENFEPIDGTLPPLIDSAPVDLAVIKAIPITTDPIIKKNEPVVVPITEPEEDYYIEEPELSAIEQFELMYGTDETPQGPPSFNEENPAEGLLREMAENPDKYSF